MTSFMHMLIKMHRELPGSSTVSVKQAPEALRLDQAGGKMPSLISQFHGSDPTS